MHRDYWHSYLLALPFSNLTKKSGMGFEYRCVNAERRNLRIRHFSVETYLRWEKASSAEEGVFGGRSDRAAESSCIF